MSKNKESDIVGPKVKAMIIEEAVEEIRRGVGGGECFRDGYDYAMHSIMKYAEDLKNKNAG